MNSYTLSVADVIINFQYSTNYKLLDPESAYYFIQVITDDVNISNYSGTGIPRVSNSISGNTSLFIMTVFGDKTNVVLMPTVYLTDVTAYKGLTLNAFGINDSNKIKLTNMSDANKNKNTALFLYNVDDNLNIIGKPGDIGSESYAIWQPISKNLAVNITGTYDSLVDSSVNTTISTLIINTQFYNYLINTAMPNYNTGGNNGGTGGNNGGTGGNNGGNGGNGGTPPPSKSMSVMGIVLLLFVIIVLTIVLTLGGAWLYKNKIQHKNTT